MLLDYRSLQESVNPVVVVLDTHDDIRKRKPKAVWEIEESADPFKGRREAVAQLRAQLGGAPVAITPMVIEAKLAARKEPDDEIAIVMFLIQ